jgi:hypothetical protein
VCEKNERHALIRLFAWVGGKAPRPRQKAGTLCGSMNELFRDSFDLRILRTLRACTWCVRKSENHEREVNFFGLFSRGRGIASLHRLSSFVERNARKRRETNVRGFDKTHKNRKEFEKNHKKKRYFFFFELFLNVRKRKKILFS